MKSLLFILALSIVYQSHGQDLIPLDSVKYYIISKNNVTKYHQADAFIEVKNTAHGLVIYEPFQHLISLDEQGDSLGELDGFEYYRWQITAINKVKGKVKIKACCCSAWMDARIEFTFEKLKSNLILVQKIIYDEDEIEIQRYTKIVVEKKDLRHFVCLKEPDPFQPGTRLPFIPLDMNQLKIATQKDFF